MFAKCSHWNFSISSTDWHGNKTWRTRGKKTMRDRKKKWGKSMSANPLKNKKIWDWIVLIQKK